MHVVPNRGGHSSSLFILVGHHIDLAGLRQFLRKSKHRPPSSYLLVYGGDGTIGQPRSASVHIPIFHDAVVQEDGSSSA